MKRSLVLALMGLLATAAVLRAGEGPTPAPLSGTRRASCVVRISADDLTLPVGARETLLEPIVRSSGVLGAAVREVTEKPEDDPAVRRKLLTPVDADFQGVPQEQVLDHLRKALDVNIVVDPSVRELGIDAEFPTTLQVKQVTAGEALKLALPNGLGYAVRPGYVLIAPKDVLATTGAPAEDSISLEVLVLMAGEDNVTMQMVLHLWKGKPAAEEVLAEICRRLEQALAQLHRQESDRLGARLAAAREEMARARSEVDRLLAEETRLRAKTGRSDLSRDGILGTIRGLEREKERLQMELAGKQARRKAVEREIAEAALLAKERLQDDPLLGVLHDMVNLREGELRRVEVRVAETERRVAELLERKAVAPAEADAMRSQAAEALAAAKATLLEAKAQLADRRRGAAQPGNGDLLAMLNGELARLAIDTAELQGRLAHVTEALQDISKRGLADIADQYETAFAVQVPMARDAYREAVRRVEELEECLRLARPPSVTVLAGAPKGD